MHALISETPSSSTTDPNYPGDMIILSTHLTPLSVRRTTRSNVGVPPDRYGFYLIMILLIMSLTLIYHLVMEHSLCLLLSYISFSKYWRDAKEDPK
jgi:hypothetical protein